LNISDRNNRGLVKLGPQDLKILLWTILTIVTSATIPLFLGISLIILQVDPFSFILRHFDSDSPNSILLFVTKSFLLCYISHIGWFALCSVLVIIVIQLHYGCFLINKSLCLVKEMSKSVIENETKKNQTKVSLHALKKQARVIPEVLLIMKLTRLILPLVDEGLFLILPFLLVFGEVILVSCNYATIKMYDSIPMPFFISVPCLSGFVVVMVQVLFPPAAMFFENSKESLALLQSLKIVATDKICIRTIKATRPPRFNFGSMFYAKRSTKTTYFESCLNDTINAVLVL